MFCKPEGGGDSDIRQVVSKLWVIQENKETYGPDQPHTHSHTHLQWLLQHELVNSTSIDVLMQGSFITIIHQQMLEAMISLP